MQQVGLPAPLVVSLALPCYARVSECSSVSSVRYSSHVVALECCILSNSLLAGGSAAPKMCFATVTRSTSLMFVMWSENTVGFDPDFSLVPVYRCLFKTNCEYQLNVSGFHVGDRI